MASTSLHPGSLGVLSNAEQNEAMKAAPRYFRKWYMRDTDGSTPGETMSEAKSPVNDFADDEFDYLKDVLAAANTVTPSAPYRISVEGQVEEYLTSPLAAGCSVKIEPSVFWKSNRAHFPHLARLALDVLAIQCSSSPSKRVFSTAGDATTSKKNRTSGETLGQKVLCEKKRSVH
ncbi:hypothetical protein RvY_11687-2 [Ramazzottius varieornatus]|uniref:HAT C-terminal dimerisation domain-containing protein n=1 Tax=Ramazzottius varieornatus TaxID=947166 RepID=A0A1D1VL99_RAMVA|nr:hypothetical protein RvY_11687-2 [Ramazzottius varieornatus]